MNDTELTRLAAKAFGDAPDAFSPLTDDGDALRLAVKLRLQLVQMDTAGGQPVLRIEGPGLDRIYELLDVDPLSATRRAIVRAAAEIGKAMP